MITYPSHTRLASAAGFPGRPTRGTSLRCEAVSGTSVTPRIANTLLVKIVEALFTFPPVFNAAASGARKKIVDRGGSLGLDFAAEIEALRSADWAAEIASITTSTNVVPPAYYITPFHAYPQGNLCMEAALEVNMAAKSVHATVMDPEGKALDPDGDERLRSSYSRCMISLLGELGAREVQDILDIGAATGLSSLALLKAFPSARVTGLELSPQFLAVGKILQRQREASSGKKKPLEFMHGLAEATGLPSESFDLVSMCLVCHELPESAARAIFREASRLLRPGGALAVMEMNPASEAFQKLLNNPIPYVVFKSTEPYLLEYVGMDLHQAMVVAGFGQPRQLENSPRHRSVVAIKQG